MFVSFEKFMDLYAPDTALKDVKIAINTANQILQIGVQEIVNYINYKADINKIMNKYNDDEIWLFNSVLDYCCVNNNLNSIPKTIPPIIITNMIDLYKNGDFAFRARKYITVHRSHAHILLAMMYNHYKFPHLAKNIIQISDDSLLRLNTIAYLLSKGFEFEFNTNGYDNDVNYNEI